KADTSVAIQLQIWPYFQKVVLARDLQYAFGHDDVPSRYAALAGDVLFNGDLRDLLDFLLNGAVQSDLNVRCTFEFSPKRKISNNDGREISVVGIGREIVDLGGPTDNDRFTGKNLIVRFVIAIDRKHVFTPLKVTLFERFHAHRDKFASIGRRT